MAPPYPFRFRMDTLATWYFTYTSRLRMIRGGIGNGFEPPGTIPHVRHGRRCSAAGPRLSQGVAGRAGRPAQEHSNEYRHPRHGFYPDRRPPASRPVQRRVGTLAGLALGPGRLRTARGRERGPG